MMIVEEKAYREFNLKLLIKKDFRRGKNIS